MESRIEKLEAALSGPLSEPATIYILNLIRKLLEESSGKNEFAFLTFFTDWAFHVRVDRKGAQTVLKLFDSWLPAIQARSKRASDGYRFLLFYGFHLEFKWFLSSLGIEGPSNKWFGDFLPHYLRIIAGSPASGGKGFRKSHITELVVELNLDGAFFWRVHHETQGVFRIGFDVSDFLTANPSHLGEPWAWTGRTAAMLPTPEGWLIDNEPDRGFLFSMYPVLSTYEEAVRHDAFIYGKILEKTPDRASLETIWDEHERTVRNLAPEVKFEQLPSPPGTRLTRTDIDMHGGPEFSLYMDCPEGVVLLVLLCREGQQDSLLPALEWMAANAVLMTRTEP